MTREERFWKDMYWPKKQEQYKKFVEAEEERYKAKREEELIRNED